MAQALSKKSMPRLPDPQRRWLLAGATLAPLLSACSATGALDALVPKGTYQGRTGVAYGSDPRQRLDVYRPLGAPPPGGAPVVLFFYGGNWTRGERADYRFVGEALASHGIVTLVADYRLSPEVRWDGLLRDSALALAWTLAHAAEQGGDPRRVMVMGHSAGAYNAAMLALDPRWLGERGLKPDRLAGWIGLAGPYDFLPIGDPEVKVAFNWPETPADSQPIQHADAKAPRTLLIAGSADTVVNAERNTEGLARKLRAAGTEVEVRLVEGLGHVRTVAALARPLDWVAPVLHPVLDFIGGPGVGQG
ncbi:MAG: esterase [Rhodoferax sp.]|nr:esterase [Rhodoferax sp.]